MTHTGTTIENVSSAVDRAEENSLNRRAIDKAFAEAGEDFLKVPINQLIARAEAIKEELRRGQRLDESCTHCDQRAEWRYESSQICQRCMDTMDAYARMSLRQFTPILRGKGGL